MTAAEVGALWEAEVTNYLVARHPEAHRLRGNEGAKDHGDIGGFRRWALDCKDHASVTPASLGLWLAQASQEARNSSKPLSAVIVRRRRHQTSDALVVMSLATFSTLEAYIDELAREAVKG